MKVSIVIPVFNSERYLRECLDSALNQTYKDIEVITVYDKSNDKSLDILKEYSDRIKIIDKKSGSMTKALNDGINTMSGKWFKYLGSDDILYPNAIEELILAAKKLESTDFILYSNYIVIDSEGKEIRKFLEPNYNELSKLESNAILLDHHYGNFTTTLMHKSLFEKYGLFDEKTSSLINDYELWLRFTIINKCRLHLVPKILAKYRQQSESVTHSKIDLCKKEGEKIRKKIILQLDPISRKECEDSLKEYRKKWPLKAKIIRFSKNMLFKVLPKSTQNKILKANLTRREIKLDEKNSSK